MGDVVSLDSRRPDPHRNGEAKCLACGHKWVAVAPLGIDELECPDCGTMRGVFDGAMSMNESYFVYACNECDGTHMRIFKHTETGGYCVVCATCGMMHDIDTVFSR